MLAACHSHHTHDLHPSESKCAALHACMPVACKRFSSGAFMNRSARVSHLYTRGAWHVFAFVTSLLHVFLRRYNACIPTSFMSHATHGQLHACRRMWAHRCKCIRPCVMPHLRYCMQHAQDSFSAHAPNQAACISRTTHSFLTHTQASIHPCGQINFHTTFSIPPAADLFTAHQQAHKRPAITTLHTHAFPAYLASIALARCSATARTRPRPSVSTTMHTTVLLLRPIDIPPSVPQSSSCPCNCSLEQRSVRNECMFPYHTHATCLSLPFFP